MKKNIFKFITIFLILASTSFATATSKTINKSILNYDNLNGTGEFVNAKGGTMGNSNGKAFDEVKGIMYLSGDFAENNYSDDVSIKLKEIFGVNPKKFNATPKSDSALFTASKKSNSNTLVLHRIKFTDGIIKDKNLALYLENNYHSGNTTSNTFYNGLKGMSSLAKLNSQLNLTFGTYIFPIVTKQTFDKVGSLNITALDTVSYFDTSKEVGEILVNGNYGNTKTKVKNLDSNNDYKSNDTNMIFWIEKYTSPNLKLGTVFNFSDSNTNMKDDDTYRNDYYGSGGIYAVYDDNSIIYTSIFSVGGDYSHLDRGNSSSIKSNTNYAVEYHSSKDMNFFTGLNNSVYKEFDFNKSYITPKAELNIIGLHQGEINEGGNYGVNIDAENSISVQPGLGAEIGRGFNPSIKHTLSLSAGVMNYVEVGDPYHDLEGSMNAFKSNNKFKIDKYDDDLVHSKISIKEGYQYLDTFGFYLHENYTISKHEEQFEYGVNVIFIF